MSAQGGSDGAAVHIPNNRGVVVVGGDDTLPVGAPDRVVHEVAVAGQDGSFAGTAPSPVPHAGRQILAAGEDGLVIGAPSRIKHHIGMAGDDGEDLAAFHVPDAGGVIQAGGD